MFNWAKGAIASVTGTQEPEYGPDAIHPVTKKAEKTPFTLLSRPDQKWIAPTTSCVETQTFYVHSTGGQMAFVQVIYSTMALTPSATFNTQVYYLDDGKTPDLWSSDTLANWSFSDDKVNLKADKCSITFSKDNSSVHIKSSTNLQSIVDLKFTKDVPGFVVGNDGTTIYGTDPKAPWGTMRHTFWPRCKVEGSILTKQGELNMDGPGTYIHALQGMKPQHAASRWNFVNIHTPSFTAIQMEFTTPPSYASTVVNIGGITSASEILFAGGPSSATHTASKDDAEVNWPEPTAVQYKWQASPAATAEGAQQASAELAGELGKRVVRIDVMGEIPAFVKTLASAAAGTRPYIYVYAPLLTLKVTMADGEVKEEQGRAFIEATFVS